MPPGLPEMQVGSGAGPIPFFPGQEGGDARFYLARLPAHAINNWRLQGQDYFRIMAASGHKTMSVFERDNQASEKDLKALNGGTIDTQMDTRGFSALSHNFQVIEITIKPGWRNG